MAGNPGITALLVGSDGSTTPRLGSAMRDRPNSTVAILKAAWTKTTMPTTGGYAAAGVAYSYTVPAGQGLEIQSILAKFVASAAVGSRYLAVMITDASGNPVFFRSDTVAVAASAVAPACAAEGFDSLNAATQAGLHGIGLKGDLFIPAGWIIYFGDSALAAGAAADDFSALAMMVNVY